MHERSRGRTDSVKGAGLFLAVAVAMAAVTGCSRPGPAQTAAAQSASPPTDYLPPPEILAMVRRADGGAAVSGTAGSGATVRLASPDGSAVRTTADHSGGWSLILPAASTPRLYSLSELAGERLVRARGYLAVLPAPASAAVELRPATSALRLEPDPRLSVATIDFDASGAAVVSGHSRPGEAVRLRLDGAEAGEDRADASGVFGVALPQALKPGLHVLTAAAGGLHASATLVVEPPAPIAAGPFAASRVAGGWRIDWVTPGGGVQSTVVFDPRGGRA
jgi:hypothetical protein